MSSFTKPLRHQRDGRRFTTTDEFGFYDEDNGLDIKVPIGTYGDGASVPPGLKYALVVLGMILLDVLTGYWNIVGWYVLLNGMSVGHPYGALFKAAVLHDHAYNMHDHSRKVADRVFLDAAKIDSQQSQHWKSLGWPGRTIRWAMRWQAYLTLRVCGNFAYKASDRNGPTGIRTDHTVAAEVNTIRHALGS